MGLFIGLRAGLRSLAPAVTDVRRRILMMLPPALFALAMVDVLFKLYIMIPVHCTSRFNGGIQGAR
jgi:hypothetical protein